MRIPLKTEPAPTKDGGRQPPGCHRNDHQRNKLLPIHALKIAPKRSRATDDLARAVPFLAIARAKCAWYHGFARAAQRFRGSRMPINTVQKHGVYRTGTRKWQWRLRGSTGNIRAPSFAKAAPLQAQRGPPRQPGLLTRTENDN